MKKKLVSIMTAALLVGSLVNAEGGSWGKWFGNLAGFTASGTAAVSGLNGLATTKLVLVR